MKNLTNNLVTNLMKKVFVYNEHYEHYEHRMTKTYWAVMIFYVSSFIS